MQKQFFIEEANGHKRAFACEVDIDNLFDSVNKQVKKYFEAEILFGSLITSYSGVYKAIILQGHETSGMIYINKESGIARIVWLESTR